MKERDKPEKIWISKQSLEDISALMGYHNDLCADVSAVMVPDTVEYIRADLAKPSEWISVELLNDDKWLADNGLKRFCKKCNGEGKIPIYTNLGGDMYLSHYEPCECVAVVNFP